MIIKILHNSLPDVCTTLCECDSVETKIVGHPRDCTCFACMSYENKNIKTNSGGFDIKQIVTYKTTEDLVTWPDGLVTHALERHMSFDLGNGDVCYVLNNEGKTIDKING